MHRGLGVQLAGRWHALCACMVRVGGGRPVQTASNVCARAAGMLQGWRSCGAWSGAATGALSHVWGWSRGIVALTNYPPCTHDKA